MCFSKPKPRYALSCRKLQKKQVGPYYGREPLGNTESTPYRVQESWNLRTLLSPISKARISMSKRRALSRLRRCISSATALPYILQVSFHYVLKLYSPYSLNLATYSFNVHMASNYNIKCYNDQALNTSALRVRRLSFPHRAAQLPPPPHHALS